MIQRWFQHVFFRAAACLVVIGGLAACSANRGIPGSPSDLVIEPVSFTPPSPVEWKLANGLTVYFLPDDELPLMKGVLVYPGGSLYEPRDRTGLAALCGSQMREGSIQGIRPEQLDRTLDSLGASVESAFNEEYGSISFSGLTEDAETILTIVSDVARRPAFDANRLSLAKQLSFEAIRRRKDDPATMAGITFARYVYGADSPYAWAPTPETIQRITRDDLIAFRRRFVRPEGAILAITGALSEAEARALVDKIFASWAGDPEQWVRPTPPPVGDTLKPGLYILPREFDQATVKIGHRGPARTTPDFYRLSVFNSVFGYGGFTSVLFREVRTKLGLAYSVWGGFDPGPVEGIFSIDAGTRAAEAGRTVERSIELAREARTELYSEDLVQLAKDSARRSFVFRFETPRQVIGRRAWLVMHGFPEDFDDTYLPRISQVDPMDVRSVAASHIHPENLVIVVVGSVPVADLVKRFGSERPIYLLHFDIEPHVIETLSAGPS
ncbi:MAG: insulinase family protein [Bdellovibrionales bacterium]|nr:insulinase family protein [Bdellovibrionales bacterium]